MDISNKATNILSYDSKLNLSNNNLKKNTKIEKSENNNYKEKNSIKTKQSNNKVDKNHDFIEVKNNVKNVQKAMGVINLSKTLKDSDFISKISKSNVKSKSSNPQLIKSLVNNIIKSKVIKFSENTIKSNLTKVIPKNYSDLKKISKAAPALGFGTGFTLGFKLKPSELKDAKVVFDKFNSGINKGLTIGSNIHKINSKIGSSLNSVKTTLSNATIGVGNFTQKMGLEKIGKFIKDIPEKVVNLDKISKSKVGKVIKQKSVNDIAKVIINRTLKAKKTIKVVPISQKIEKLNKISKPLGISIGCLLGSNLTSNQIKSLSTTAVKFVKGATLGIKVGTSTAKIVTKIGTTFGKISPALGFALGMSGAVLATNDAIKSKTTSGKIVHSTRAGLNVISAVASFVPVVGTTVSLVATGADIALDISSKKFGWK